MLTVGVLGRVEAHRDGVRLDVPAGKTSELLARLALEAGALIRADVLVEDLWGGPASRNTLQSKVSQLRKALGDKNLVEGSGDSYRLVVPASAVDAARAAQQAREAAGERARGDAAASLRLASDGLRLFRGEVLPGAADWAAPHRTRLEEVRLSLVEDALAARVQLGYTGDVVGELEELVARNPLRERLWATLVVALYRGGRQADALAAYSRVRRLLVDELGVEPGPELRGLEQQVLRQSLDAGPPLLAASPGNLPAVASPMVGRSADLAAVSAALAQHRLVSVVGPAGVGKTRLSLEVAEGLEAPGGVWLVRLDDIDHASQASQVGQLVAETLQAPSLDALVDRLAGTSVYLLLDNCEHVADEVGAMAARLLAASPLVRILVTSQVPLGLDEENLHALDHLTLEESVRLFTERARRARRRLVVDADTAEAIAEVCQSLDGLPLAIELAASRARSLSIGDIARRLEDRFALLRDPASRRAERRRTLAGAISWSYDLLFPDDQRGLWALSCFAGGAAPEAAERVVEALGVPTESVLDTFGRLVDRSLLIVDEADGGGVRYRLLDSIRAYAAERLHESGQADVAAAAHAAWLADLGDWCEAHVRGERQPECLAVARAERANVDAALAWCGEHDRAQGARIALGFGWTWVVLGDGSAGAARVRAAVDQTAVDQAAVDQAARAAGLMLAGWLEASAGDVALAQQDLDAATDLVDDLAGRLDDEVLRAEVQRHQAFVAIQQGRPELVRSSASAAVATYRRHGLNWHTAAGLLLSAFGALMLGRTGTAAEEATEALGLLTPIGDSWGLVHAQAMLGGIALAERRFEDAVRALARAADESATRGFPAQAALHRATLGRAQQRLGDPAAAASYERAIGEAAAVGDGRLAATARLHLARLLRAAGRSDAAVALLEDNERWYSSAGGGDFALLNHCLLAAERGDSRELTRAVSEARASGNLEVQVYGLDALARTAAESGDLPAARANLAEADALAPAVAHAVDAADRLDAARARDVIDPD